MTQTITYKFFAAKEEVVHIDLNFDDHTFQIQPDPAVEKPSWAKLEHQKCSNCPLGADVEWCPTAVSIAQFLPHFTEKFSYEKTVIEVETPLRSIITKSTFQTGIASLLGLVCATSGCPHTKFLRPLARFHLPFANEQETVFRALAANLLAQYVENSNNGGQKALNFDELNKNYAQLSIVNGFLAERLRDGVERDAALNAVIILDGLALITPENTDGSFEDLEDVFVVE
ncbi:conserved hypothetical protein [Candidatus Terasakiella magnetica]|uniref:Uncharacterized protein n=1 Tax=Candidatus Terasakiella magnetica TaxID=1867952 RepID=A0A1C3REM1_9PROT|nr:hypothetical protein [Candidatus Terasakiella magnetica]SCA55705.1 conserved hypothetical protein [Candidatus Terasakiella magnetica]